MVVTIADRCVTFIPMELESQLQLEPCCQHCKATDKHLRTCSSCKMVTFCSRECQAADWKRHKKEDECVVIKKLRRKVDGCEETIRSRHVELVTLYERDIGQDAFFGREIIGNNAFELLAGRFGERDAYTNSYLQAMFSLYAKLFYAAKRLQTRSLWEELLGLGVEMRRLSHVSRPFFMEFILPVLLLKLHRDDDATECIYSWARSRVRNASVDGPPANQSVINSRLGEWPFPSGRSIAANDVVESLTFCKSLNLQGDSMEVVSAAVTILMTKLRPMTVYRRLLLRFDAFLETASSQCLPQDVKSVIKLFLTDGPEGEARYREQSNYANRMMNFIDEYYPEVLPAVLLPSVDDKAANGELNVGARFNARIFVRVFVQTYGDGAPIMETLKDVLMERYSQQY